MSLYRRLLLSAAAAAHRPIPPPHSAALTRHFCTSITPSASSSAAAVAAEEASEQIQSHCKSGDVGKALDVYGAATSLPVAPSAAAYRNLTRTLVDSGRIGPATDVLREMLHRGRSDELVFDHLIKGHIDLDQWEEALQLYMTAKTGIWCVIQGIRIPTTWRPVAGKRKPKKSKPPRRWKLATLCWPKLSCQPCGSGGEGEDEEEGDLKRFMERRRMVLAMVPSGKKSTWVFPNGGGEVDSFHVRCGYDPVVEEMKKALVLVEKDGVFHISRNPADKKRAFTFQSGGRRSRRGGGDDVGDSKLEGKKARR